MMTDDGMGGIAARGLVGNACSHAWAAYEPPIGMVAITAMALPKFRNDPVTQSRED